jgi:mannosyltransferase
MPPGSAAVNQNAVDSTYPSSISVCLQWLLVLFLFAVGIALRLKCLACKPFWFDESFSAEVARLDWSNFLHLLWWREANMSLYYVVLRLWMFFGHSEFFIRALSVMLAAATLPAIYWLARQLYDRRVAWIATTLLTFNAYHVRYAQEARSYSLFVLLATLSSGFLIAFLRQPSRRNRVAFILFSVLAVYAHFYALLLLAAQWLAVRRMRSPDEPKDAILTAQLRRAWTSIGLAVLPLLIFVAKTGAGPIRWIPRPGIQDLLAFFTHLAGSYAWPLPVLYTVACGVALVPIGRKLWNRDLKSGQSWEAWRCQFLLLWLAFPILLTVFVSFIRPVFLGRYMIFCLPPLVILAAAGLSRLRQSWMRVSALTVMLILSLYGILFVYGHDFDNERDASGEAANFILAHALPGDAIVFHIADTRVAYEFFHSLRPEEPSGPEILFPHHADGLDYRDFTGKPTAEFLRTAAPPHPRIWLMLMNNQPAGSADPTTGMITQILSESFPTMQQWQFPKVEVRLYNKPTNQP